MGIAVQLNVKKHVAIIAVFPFQWNPKGLKKIKTCSAIPKVQLKSTPTFERVKLIQLKPLKWFKGSSYYKNEINYLFIYIYLFINLMLVTFWYFNRQALGMQVYRR